MMSSSASGKAYPAYLNITDRLGGRFIPSEDDPKIAAPGTSLMIPEKRGTVLRPEICTFYLNTMTFGKQVEN